MRKHNKLKIQENKKENFIFHTFLVENGCKYLFERSMYDFFFFSLSRNSINQVVGEKKLFYDTFDDTYELSTRFVQTLYDVDTLNKFCATQQAQNKMSE